MELDLGKITIESSSELSLTIINVEFFTVGELAKIEKRFTRLKGNLLNAGY